MKESMWGYAIIALGVMIISFMLLVQNLTSTSEEDFYLSREVLEASMYDAIDYGTYAKSGKLVMSEQKFVEVFLRRFAESVTNNKDYKIDFYDVHEYPPKATVTITTSTGTEKILSDDVNINAVTYLNAILETTYNYNKEVSFSGGTAFRAEDYTESSLSSGKVTLTFKYLAENDPCGYYRGIDDDKMVISKDPNISSIDKSIEYCYISDSNKNNYYVRKSSLSISSK